MGTQIVFGANSRKKNKSFSSPGHFERLSGLASVRFEVIVSVALLLALLCLLGLPVTPTTSPAARCPSPVPLLGWNSTWKKKWQNSERELDPKIHHGLLILTFEMAEFSLVEIGASALVVASSGLVLGGGGNARSSVLAAMRSLATGVDSACLGVVLIVVVEAAARRYLVSDLRGLQKVRQLVVDRHL